MPTLIFICSTNICLQYKVCKPEMEDKDCDIGFSISITPLMVSSRSKAMSEAGIIDIHIKKTDKGRSRKWCILNQRKLMAGKN